jgi:RNA polymerase sigma-70 factor (ECF subfamily)
VNESPDEIALMTESFLREQSGDLTASFARIFGAHHLDLAERVARRTLLSAARRWPFAGIPQSPSRWLRAEARRQAQLQLEREGTVRSRILLLLQEFLPREHGADVFVNELEAQLQDDRMKLLFLLCHPLLPEGIRAPLVLKLLCGWSPAECAELWGGDSETVEEGLGAARRKIKVRRLSLAFPKGEERAPRVRLVAATLYELLSLPDRGPRNERSSLEFRAAHDTVRLVLRWSAHTEGRDPVAQALMAWLCLRPENDPRRLPEELRVSEIRVARGLESLELAARGGPLSPLHFLAGTAACALLPEGSAAGPARRILSYFDTLLKIEDTPATALHRANAFFRLLGPGSAPEILGQGAQAASFRAESLLPAAYAELYARQGEPGRARHFYQEALRRADTVAARRFLMKKLNA